MRRLFLDDNQRYTRFGLESTNLSQQSFQRYLHQISSLLFKSVIKVRREKARAVQCHPHFVCCVLACFSSRRTPERALAQAQQSRNGCILPLLSCSTNSKQLAPSPVHRTDESTRSGRSRGRAVRLQRYYSGLVCPLLHPAPIPWKVLRLPR